MKDNKFESYKKSFDFLTKYDVKKGVNKSLLKEDDGDDKPPVLDDLTDSDETTKPSLINKDVEFENTEEVEKIKKEEELAKKSDIDRVKEIQDMQTEKIGELEDYLQELGQYIDELNDKTVDIDAIKTNLDVLKQQVKDITPPTPEESLEKMAKISGGITMEDYWAKYFEENKPYKTIVSTNQENEEENTSQDEQNKSVTYVVSVKDIKSDYNESEVKDSLF